MRWAERQEGESSKAFRAFATYRDLGADRTLRTACELIYGGSAANLRQVEEWSRTHDWVERAAAFDDWKAMLVQHELAEMERETAGEVAAREQKLKEAVLEIRELAARKAKTMLAWPLVEEVVDRDVDGREVAIHYYPARWSMGTVPGLVAIMKGGEGDVPADELAELDTSVFTEQEMQAILDLSAKLGVKKPPR